ncbi:hypothetical protein OHA79_52665 (plasmid) [Streptomyces sp. NBC_00841]|uniref:hypothetical protein n=1 Tax=Streptomyces sp. NBC_00841 TaxID=2975847 RepID=UPI002DDBF1FD|nr:hypothetical protein [Streptomyces sp. NBC_00841]WSA06123.1 hypothetical protein OHA79_52665 [Streptomyces sp. NBC_00841]
MAEADHLVAALEAETVAGAPADRPSWSEGEPSGCHLANASIWDDSSAYSHPRATV